MVVLMLLDAGMENTQRAEQKNRMPNRGRPRKVIDQEVEAVARSVRTSSILAMQCK